MIRKLMLVLALALVAVCFSAPAMADNIHLCDINNFTSCNAGNAIQVQTGTTQAWAFGTANSNENLYIAVLTPNAGKNGNFLAGTNLWAVLGISPTQVFPDFASTVSQEQLATGMTAQSFSASYFSVGAWTGSVTLGQTVALPGGVPIGTIFIAFLTDAQGNLVAVSPWSSSLITVSNVPEPSSLMLLGTGLLAIGGFARRRFTKN